MEQMKEKERVLPTIKLSGIEFHVDAVSSMLIEVENTTNTIHALELMAVDDHYEFVFDKQRRNLKETDWNERDNDNCELIWLRPFGVYDKQGAELLMEENPALTPKKLPTLLIESEPFYWDKLRGQLVQVSNPFNRIGKYELQYGFHFDLKEKVALFPHESELLNGENSLPGHVRFIDPKTISTKINKAIELDEKSGLNSKTRKRLKH